MVEGPCVSSSSSSSGHPKHDPDAMLSSGNAACIWPRKIFVFSCFSSVFATLPSLFLARDFHLHFVHFCLFSLPHFLTPRVRFPGFLHVLHFNFRFFVCVFCILWFWSFFVCLPFRLCVFLASASWVCAFCRVFCVSGLRLLGLRFVDWPRSARFFFGGFMWGGMGEGGGWGEEGGGWGGGDNNVHVGNLPKSKARNPDSASPKPSSPLSPALRHGSAVDVSPMWPAQTECFPPSAEHKLQQAQAVTTMHQAKTD